MRKAEEYVRCALEGGCLGRRAFLELLVPTEDARTVSREMRSTALHQGANSSSDAISEQCVPASSSPADGSGGNDPLSLRAGPTHCSHFNPLKDAYVSEVKLTFFRDPECRFSCCTEKQCQTSTIFHRANGAAPREPLLGSSNIRWNYPIYIGTDACENASGQLWRALNSGKRVSSVFVFIDDAVLEHANHRRRLKSLARGLVAASDEPRFSSESPEDFACLNCTACPTEESSCTLEHGELCNSVDQAGSHELCRYTCCCICCSPFAPVNGIVASKGEHDDSHCIEQGLHPCSTQSSSEVAVPNTPIVFFALKGGEQCKTLSAVEVIQCAILGINDQCTSRNEAAQSLGLRRIFYRTRISPVHRTIDSLTHFDVPVDRASLLVGIGGGAVTDLIGFSASTLLRGVRFCLVPTTLLAACDAAVGGKTAVNCGGLKNSVGSFSAPAACLIDTSFFSSLPLRLRAAGMAEVLKIEQNELLRITAAAVILKALVVTDDFRDNGVRKVLNFGHTFGHAIESIEGASWLHGECVGVGMLFELLVGRRVAVGGSLLYFLIKESLRRFGLPTSTSCLTYEEQQQMLSLMQGDKKNYCGDVHVVLLDHLASPVKTFTRPIPVDILKQTLASERRLNFSSPQHTALSGHVTLPGGDLFAPPNFCSICVTRVIGSKSIANRVMLLAAIRAAVFGRRTCIRNLPCCSDCCCMALALKRLNFSAVIIHQEDDPRSFSAVFSPYKNPEKSPVMRSLCQGGRVSLWCGGSGTASRFLLPTIAALLLEAAFSYIWNALSSGRAFDPISLNDSTTGGDVLPRFEVLLDGDSQLRRRPIGPLVTATREFVQCCDIAYLDNRDFLPILMSVDPSTLLPQIQRLQQQTCDSARNQGRASAWHAVLASCIPQEEVFVSNCESSQFASALMIAAVLGSKSTRVRLTNGRERSVVDPNGVSSPSSGSKIPHGVTCYDDFLIRDTNQIKSLPYLLMTKSLLKRLGFACDYHSPASFSVESAWYSERHESKSFAIVPGGEDCHSEATTETSDECEEYVVEADASSASYFFGMAACTGGAVTVNINPKPELQGDCSFPYILKVLGCIVTTKCMRPLQIGCSPLCQNENVSVCLEGPLAGVIPHGESVVIDLKNHSDCLPTLAATVAAMATQCERQIQRGQKVCPYNNFPSAPVIEQLRSLCIEALESHKRKRTSGECNITSVGTASTYVDTLTSTWPLRTNNWRIVVICGVDFVRYKESDRLSVLEVELARAGYCVWSGQDYLCIAVPIESRLDDKCCDLRPAKGQWDGRESPCLPLEERDNLYLSCAGDHRLAMSWALLGLRRQDVFASDWKCVDKTFADFWTTAEKDLRLVIKAPDSSQIQKND